MTPSLRAIRQRLDALWPDSHDPPPSVPVPEPVPPPIDAPTLAPRNPRLPRWDPDREERRRWQSE